MIITQSVRAGINKTLNKRDRHFVLMGPLLQQPLKSSYDNDRNSKLKEGRNSLSRKPPKAQ